MKKYLLDTDIISFAGDSESEFYRPIIKHFKSLKKGDVLYISDLSLYEYKSGLFFLEGEERERILSGFEKIMRYLTVLPLNPDDGGEMFGKIRKKYKEKTGINDNALKKYTIDMILASEAIVNNAVLVYNDRIYEKIYDKIVDMRNDFIIENWTK